MSVRLLGFTPEIGPYRRQPYDAGDRSCLGLCLLQGCRPRPAIRGWILPVVRARMRARPRIASPASGERLSRSANPLVGVTASFPVEKSFQAAAAEMTFRLPGCLFSRPRAPALQRVVGLMPVRSAACSESRRIDSLSEVLHRP